MTYKVMLTGGIEEHEGFRIITIASFMDIEE
jgi:hypothetical protein